MRGRVSEEMRITPRNEFWGICCEGGLKYSQVVSQRFLITMAALEPEVTNELPENPYVSLLVERDGCEYLLCTLKHRDILQVNLNLHFAKGENVTFALRGKGTVHLSGYHIYSDNEEEMNDAKHSENVEKNLRVHKGKKQKSLNKSKVPKTTDESDSEVCEEISGSEMKDEGIWEERKAKRLARQLWNADQGDNEEEDDDDDDEDYQEGDEIDDEDDEEEDEEENEADEEEESSLDEDEDDIEEVPTKKGSSKRKMPVDAQERKRLKKRMSASGSEAEQSWIEGSGQMTEVIEIDDEDMKFEELSDSGEMNSSIGRTPMPGKKFMPSIQSNSSISTKKGKKKNKDEIPNKREQMLMSGNTYSKKMPCGVEYEDIKLGNGPVARRGKCVHVYFVGKLGNGKIFDERREGHKPFSFKMGENHVIKGWDRGLEGMRVGGRRKLKIPPKLGYGKMGNDVIPPDSTLYFIVDLKAVS